MWDESLIESRRLKNGKKRWMTVPVSLLVHAAAIAFVIATSYVVAVPDPHIPVIILSPEPLPPPLPPGGSRTREARPQTVQPQQPVVQPINIPENLPSPEPTPDQSGGGNEGGVLGGQVGGVPGGDAINGILGGDPIGVPGAIGEEEPVIIDHGIEQPVLIKKVEPVYPETARRLHIQGTVILQAVINREGSVEQLEILKSVHRLLDQSAIDAVSQWKYRPAMFGNKPVKVYFKVTVVFTLT